MHESKGDNEPVRGEELPKPLYHCHYNRRREDMSYMEYIEFKHGDWIIRINCWEESAQGEAVYSGPDNRYALCGRNTCAHITVELMDPNISGTEELHDRWEWRE